MEADGLHVLRSSHHDARDSMPTSEIQRPEWKTFFDSFTRKHEGWLVTIEELSAEIGDQIELKDVPLEGITAETNGEDSIEIVLINKRGDHISRTIDRPRRVWLKHRENGADEVLEIEGETGATLVYFRSLVAPSEVDGG
jgi:hypothetical protein